MKIDKNKFVKDILDFSMKKGIDEKSKERLINIVSKEVDNTELNREILERIKKIENVVLGKGNGEKKIKGIDLSTHKPLNTVEFIDLFRDSNGIKYLTHKFEKPGEMFNREDIMEIAENEFNNFIEKKQISLALYSTFKVFAFGEGKYKGKWYFNNNMFHLNWMSEEIKEWCKNNKGMHPIEKYEKELIKPFQSCYKIENGMLKTYILQKIASSLGDDYSSFEIQIIDCEKANFKTDVESLLKGLSIIFTSIKQRKEKSKKINIQFNRKGRKRFLKIIHIDSKSDKSFETNLEKEILGGDLESAKNSFYRVCDWSIVSKNPSEKINKLNILYDINSVKPKEFTEEKIIGFTHILTFYS